MPLDAVCLSALKSELCEKTLNMRIDKIQQPENDTLLLSLRGINGAAKLLICAGSGNCRVHLTDERYDNPQNPPMFCMLMRKHISGAKISTVTQPVGERIVDFELDSYDAMGISCKKHLVVELIGNYSNIILTDENMVIFDCLRKIGGGMDDSRRVLPGLIYRLPDAQKKADITLMDRQQFELIFESAALDQKLDKLILDNFLGFSPLVSRDIVFRAYGETDKRVFEAMASDRGESLYAELLKIRDKIINADFRPYMISDQDGKPRDFSYFEIKQYEGSLSVLPVDSFSVLLDEYYSKRDKLEKMRQKSQSLLKSVKNAYDRTKRKLELQRKELAETLDRELLRQRADIIMANLHCMEKGMKILRAYNFYDENGGECEIPLDVTKSPQQNASKYYKDYSKAKNAEQYLTEQIMYGENELKYLESVLDEIERAESESDLGEIRSELTNTKYLKQQKNPRKERQKQLKPMQFKSSAGMDIFVGKNNIQNDTLTLKTAYKRDMWLHVQKIHGSHVIIASDGAIPDESTMFEAAVLAAYYSQGRQSQKVPVDYTLVKNVKKPSGGRPGMVIYTDYKTMFVTPDEKLVERLRVK